MEATPRRGLHVPRGAPFVLPYLPFLIVFGIAPTIYALDLAFTNAGGDWVGFHNFVRAYDDFRVARGLDRSDRTAADGFRRVEDKIIASGRKPGAGDNL